MKKLFQKMLASYAHKILVKYHPKVVGITGSIGKTSAKTAIYEVLRSKYITRTNEKNFNNEFGLPLTVIGSTSPKRNAFKWIAVFWKATRMLYSHYDYPEVLVLEMGIDRPGDMDYLVDIVQPNTGVITNIGVSHLEYFGSSELIQKEKIKILKYVRDDGFAILNYDDAYLRELLPKLKCNIITFGINLGASVHLLNYKSVYLQNIKSFGTEINLSLRDQRAQIFLNGIIGLPHVQACLTAAAIGLSCGISLADVAEALKDYHGEPGRLRLLNGTNGSKIIDDTYNAAPLSTEVALKELRDFPAAHKIVVLGDMLELGKLSLDAHRNLAAIIMHSGADYFVGVGKMMRLTAEQLKHHGFRIEHIFSFDNSVEAIAKVKELIRNDSVVLIKGSQGMRMEKIVQQVMTDPRQARLLLCRQDPDWLKKK